MKPVRALFALVPALLAGCATAPGAFPPVKAQGYPGAPLPESEVATVFIVNGRPHYEAGFICAIDDKAAGTGGGCASIAYVRPGSHVFHIHYLAPNGATCEVYYPLDTRADRLYQLNATGFPTQHVCRVDTIPMARGLRLVYRNVTPGLAPAAVLDQPVPYGLP